MQVPLAAVELAQYLTGPQEEAEWRTRFQAMSLSQILASRRGNFGIPYSSVRRAVYVEGTLWKGPSRLEVEVPGKKFVFEGPKFTRDPEMDKVAKRIVEWALQGRFEYRQA